MNIYEINNDCALVENNEGFVHLIAFKNSESYRPNSDSGFIGYRKGNSFVMIDFCTLASTRYYDSVYEQAKQFIKDKYKNVLDYNEVIDNVEKRLNKIIIDTYAKKYPTLETLKEVVSVEDIESYFYNDVHEYYHHKCGLGYKDYNPYILTSATFFNPQFALENFEKNDEELFNAFISRYEGEKLEQMNKIFTNYLYRYYLLKNYKENNHSAFLSFAKSMYDNQEKKTFAFEFDCKELLNNYYERVTSNHLYKDDDNKDANTKKHVLDLMAEFLEKHDTVTIKFVKTNITLKYEELFLTNIPWEELEQFGEEIKNCFENSTITAIFNCFNALVQVTNGRKVIYKK